MATSDAAKTMMAGTGGRAARAFVESFAEIELGGAKSGGDAEEQAGEDGNHDREERARSDRARW